MPAFDLALSLRMVGRATERVRMFCASSHSAEISRDAAGTVIAEQAWLMDDPCLVTA